MGVARRLPAAALLLCSLFSIAVTAPSRPGTANIGASAWDKFNEQTSGLVLSGASVGDQLGPVMAHQFSTPLTQIQSSNVYSAGNARFRRVINDLRQGKAVKIVALGGLATNGSDASQPGRNDYFALFVNYLARAFPRSQIAAVRSSVGVAPSAVVAQCFENFVPTDADLVMLEMTANDGQFMDNSIIFSHNAKAYELLMRKVLSGSKQPALLLTQTMVPGMGNAKTPFYLTPEAPQYAALSSYYGTPVVSMRNALWRSGSPQSDGMIKLTAVSPTDGATPLDAGHRSIADMLVFYTQRTAQDLLLLPYGEYDRNSMSRDLPDTPVYSDVTNNPNSVIQNSTCFWLRNISSNADRRCPHKMAQMCNFDYGSRQAFLTTFDQSADLSEESSTSSLGVLIGAIVGGVVGGLLLLGGLLWCCIQKKKKHQQRIAEQVEAKLAARKLASQASRAGSGSAPGAAVPITASSAAHHTAV